MNKQSSWVVFGAALLSSLMACSDATAPSANSTTTVNADIAQSAGADIASDYSFYSGASGSSTTNGNVSFSLEAPTSSLHPSASLSIPTHPAADWISSACQFTATGPFSQFFVCPGITKTVVGAGGSDTAYHHYAIVYQLFDSLGAIQSAYNTVSTDSITFNVADTTQRIRHFNGDTFADTIRRQHVATVSNLKGAPDTLHIWNATGNGTVMSVRSGQITKIYQLTSMDTTVGLKIKQPRDVNPYPVSGMIIRNYTVIRTRLASDTTHFQTTRRVVVTFNGTANVPMMIGSDAYLLNLDTHVVTKQ